MKEITIQIRILDDEKIATVVKKSGYDNGLSSMFEVIGTIENVLCNIKQSELGKLKLYFEKK